MAFNIENLFNFNQNSPFVIAEISCNHMGEKKILKSTIDAAFSSKADAVKLQSSEPNCLTRNFGGTEFKVNDLNSPWHGIHLWKLYQETCTPINWPISFINKKDYGSKIIFSTPFSPKMVSFLEDNAQPKIYKISSIDWNYFELLEACILTGKPVLISLVKPSVQLPFLQDKGFKSLIPLYCISKYPAQPSDCNIDELRFLSKNCSNIFGFSDHSIGTSLSSLAVSYGAKIIEKHFMLNKNIISQDAHFSSTPDQFEELVYNSKNIYKAINSKNDSTVIPIGRSIYIDNDIKAGEVIERRNLCIIRPGGGLAPDKLEYVVGKRAKVDILKGERLRQEHFS